MAAAWEMPIPATEKMVLLCLCDYANDEGRNCFPAVGTVAKKCSKGVRTVQMAIRWLREHEILDIQDSPGKPHTFMLDPRKICTPAETAPPQKSARPPQKLRHTPADSAPKPSYNHQEPPVKNIRAKVSKPDGVGVEVWDDFLAVRKAKRSPLTPTALKAIEREAEKAGWTLDAAITESVARGWQGFKAEWVKERANGRQSGNSTLRELAERSIADG